jgi:hypothetical protein
MRPCQPILSLVPIVHLLITALLLGGALSPADAAEARKDVPIEKQRFVLLDAAGRALSAHPSSAWSCVLDRQTGLIWEVKRDQPGLHYRHNTYSWFNPDATRNGGLAGQPGGNDCTQLACDTQAFVDAVNAAGLCGAHDWRLPRREELRSLVDYRTPYPGPTLNQAVFPHAVAQFYWSADPAAADAMEAWGIGFAHGFDYAYFKSNRVHVRLVRFSR